MQDADSDVTAETAGGGKHERSSPPQPACAAASSICSLVPPVESLLTPAVTAHFLHLFPAASLVHLQSLLPSASSPPSHALPVYLLSHAQPSRRSELTIVACSSQGGVPLRAVQRGLLQGQRRVDVVLAVVDLHLTVICLRLRDGIAPLSKHRQRKATRTPKAAAAAATAALPTPASPAATLDGMEEERAVDGEEQAEDEKG